MNKNMPNKEPQLALIGINHKTSSIAEREPFQLSNKDIPLSLRTIISFNGVEGVLILSTCNRLEIFLSIMPDITPFEIARKFFLEKKNIDINTKKNIFYTYESAKIPRHLFKVITGLESLVLGEYQIQGQVKDAYSIACENKTVEKMLHRLLHSAFRTGKKVRSKTCLGKCKQSVSGVASEIMIESLNKNDTIAIIGVNENSKIIATALMSAGFHDLIFVNRTFYKAEMLSEQFGGRAEDFGNLEKVLFDADAVYSSTGAPGYIISSDMLSRLTIQERCPRLIIDMAVPRDVDTSNLPPEIRSYNITDLKNYLDKQRDNTLIDIPEAEKLIEDEVKLFQAWSETQADTILKPFAEKFEEIRQQILDETIEQFSDNDFKKVDKLSKHLVHRLQSTFVRILIKYRGI